MNWIKALATLGLSAALAGCGGGGGSSGSSAFPGGGSGGGSAGVATVTVSLSSTTVTGAAPVTVTALVRDGAGAAVSGQVVSFTTTGSLGTFSPASALTDATGTAAVKLAPASANANGADSVVAVATVNSIKVTGTTGFQVVPTNGTVGTPSIALSLSTTTVTTTTPATVTAAVKDANNAPVAGQVVTFTAPGGLGAFSPASALTDANGNAVVKLAPFSAITTGADLAVASVIFNAASLTASQGFQVIIANADLILTTSSAQIANTGSGEVAITVKAIDANRNTVPGVPVSISVDGNAVVTGAAARTDANGVVSARLTIGAERANRLLTVTAIAGSITRTSTVQVVGTTITSSLVPAVIPQSTVGAVLYRVVDQAGNAMANQAAQIVATGLTPSQATGTTGANGDFTFNYTSPAADGSFAITANIAGKTDVQTLLVQSVGAVPDAVGQINAASISANPSVVPVNLPNSEANRSEVRVLFLGTSNLPIKNVRAKFDLNGDPKSIGGKFTTGSTTLYSDVNGVATTAYVPATRSSPTDGVEVRVCYGARDVDLVGCPNSKLVTLTVTAEPLGVSIGTNEQIIVNTLTYVKQFVITVADSAGVAKPDVNLVASVDLPQYRKGYYAVVGGKWVKQGPLPGGDFARCRNEDTNRNGVLEADEDDKLRPGGDGNGDGQLWPRKPDVIVSLLQSKTGSDGTAVLQILYAKDHGSWVDALITVSASGVAGSEGRASYLAAPVPVDAASINNTATSPAYQLSPYGIGADCRKPD